MKNFIIDIDIYTARIHIIYNNTDGEFNEYILNNFSLVVPRPKTDASYWSFTSDNGTTQYLIDFPHKLKQTDYNDINTITHEALHVTFDIMNTVKIKYDYENEEPFCYLNGLVNEKIFEGLFKKTPSK